MVQIKGKGKSKLRKRLNGRIIVKKILRQQDILRARRLKFKKMKEKNI